MYFLMFNTFDMCEVRRQLGIVVIIDKIIIAAQTVLTKQAV